MSGISKREARSIVVRFGKRVRELRADRTQAEVAEEIPMAAENLCRLEKGSGTEGPSLVRIHEIARALDVTVSALVED